MCMCSQYRCHSCLCQFELGSNSVAPGAQLEPSSSRIGDREFPPQDLTTLISIKLVAVTLTEAGVSGGRPARRRTGSLLYSRVLCQNLALSVQVCNDTLPVCLSVIATNGTHHSFCSTSWVMGSVAGFNIRASGPCAWIVSLFELAPLRATLRALTLQLTVVTL